MTAYARLQFIDIWSIEPILVKSDVYYFFGTRLCAYATSKSIFEFGYLGRHKRLVNLLV